MDEFDVFMDQMSRRIAVDALINMSDEFKNRQFILITPLDLSFVNEGPAVKKIILRPPERGQQTLDD